MIGGSGIYGGGSGRFSERDVDIKAQDDDGIITGLPKDEEGLGPVEASRSVLNGRKGGDKGSDGDKKVEEAACAGNFGDLM